MAKSAKLPPLVLPPLNDPVYGGPSPYSVSPLKDVTGTRINPDALESYANRAMMLDPVEAPLSCAHPWLEDWLANIGCFDPRAKVRQTPLESWDLHAIVPRISVWGDKLPFPLPKGTYLIDYRYLNSRPGQPPERPWVPRLSERFAEGSQLLLGFFGDPQLNWGLWGQRDFWTLDFLSQFAGVIAPDFAAYGDDPIPESLRGERMLQIFCSEGSRHGHNIIPSIAWRSVDSFRRQVELWSGMYPDVHTIQLDCDGFGVNPNMWWWRWLHAMENYCQGLDHIRWIITGRPKGWVVRELNRIFPKRNYCLVPSVALYNSCLSSSRGQVWMEETFTRKIQILEDFWAGETVADAQPRPDFWPQFRDCLVEEELPKLPSPQAALTE
jgi:hypothetical protein